jgi:predicted ATP-dependent protease
MPDSSARTAFQVAPQGLRWICDPAELKVASTAEVPVRKAIVGQARAARALDFGLIIDQPGYNTYVSGPSGTGRSTYVRERVMDVARTRAVPPDWCYVHNFSTPDQPMAMAFPRGQGRGFQQHVADLVDDVRDGVRRAFASELYEERRTELARRYEQRIADLWAALEAEAKAHAMLIQRGPFGIVAMPVDLQGRPIPEEIFRALPAAQQALLEAQTKGLGERIAETSRKVRAFEREARDALRQFDVDTAKSVIDGPVARVKEAYKDEAKVSAFLDAVEREMLGHLSDLRALADEDASPQARLAQLLAFGRRDFLARYRVNLLVDRQAETGAPVIVETNPTYYNLLGRAEYRAEFGAVTTDFTMIQAGALHRANGGYLLLQLTDVLRNPFAYEGLKRALRHREIRIEPLGAALGILPISTLRPEPIPLDVKVVLIGTAELYYLLYALDEEFEKLFKIHADFDVVVDRTPETQQEYVGAIAAMCRRSGLCDFDASAIAGVLEYSARLAGRQDKLSTRFGKVREIIFEAAALALQRGRGLVAREDVRSAIEDKVLRSSLVEDNIREAMIKGQFLIDTDGAAVGQINGVSMLQLGDYAFGRPSRITARAYVGGGGVVNIERESRLSGRIHSKSVFVLSSFLAWRFAQVHPLSLSASLTFEQVYSDVEGDSASSTELYALLSELAGLPIDQGIAATGSLNQMGELQPVSGVNEKIEGFYSVCKAKGLTGRQGVIIPHQNVSNLMLREDVVAAVREGRFHVWAVRTTDEGIEILTGTPAGTPDEMGVYPPNSVNGRVAARLADLARRYQEFGAAVEDRRLNHEPTP